MHTELCNPRKAFAFRDDLTFRLKSVIFRHHQNLRKAGMRSLLQTNVGYTYNADGQLAKVLDQNRHEIQFNWSKFGLDSKTTAAGQLASATHGDKTENFLWDGLALIHRGETSYLNEPYVTGGNPILSSKGDVMFNDMLGNTLGVKTEKLFRPVKMTAFGETEDKEAMFTGKPYVGELGYAFLMRNYRPEQGKWTSQDPIGIASNLPVPEKSYHQISEGVELGYPDGWNNLAYVNNNITMNIDWQGTIWVTVSDNGAPVNSHDEQVIETSPGGIFAPRRTLQTTDCTYTLDHIENSYLGNTMWGQYWYYTGTKTVVTQVQIKPEDTKTYVNSSNPEDRTEATTAITYTRAIIRRWVE